MLRAIDTVRAVCWASPFILASRYNTYASCYPMSHVGARVLRHFGLNATVVPAAAFVTEQRAGVIYNNAIGATPHQVEVFAKNVGLVASEPEPGSVFEPGHAIILVHLKQNKIYVDLTIGQARPFGFNVPLYLYTKSATWPTLQNGGTFITYMPGDVGATNSLEGITMCESHDKSFDAMTLDFVDMSKLAMNCHTLEAYYAEVCGQNTWASEMTDKLEMMLLPVPTTSPE